MFHSYLPDRIQNEEKELDELEKVLDGKEEFWNKKIEDITTVLSNSSWKFWKYIELYYFKNIKKPRDLKQWYSQIEKQNNLIQNLNDQPEIVFNEEQYELINEIDQIQSIMDSSDYSGAYGELQVLKELEQLDDRYHVFCDLSISLKDYVTYKGKRNLKSAQMDFVVVGPTGFYIIEVKNWSDSFKDVHDGLSPYEQLGRAGLVLWIYLKNRFFFYKPPVTKILVSMKGNFSYNKRYKSVFVKHYKGLNNFILNSKNEIKESKLNKVVQSLKNKM